MTSTRTGIVTYRGAVYASHCDHIGHMNIAYSKELFAGDVIEIRSCVLEVADKRLRVRHEMHNIETGELAATCEIAAVHLDKQAHKSCDLPPAIRAAAEALLAGSR